MMVGASKLMGGVWCNGGVTRSEFVAALLHPVTPPVTALRPPIEPNLVVVTLNTGNGLIGPIQPETAPSAGVHELWLQARKALVRP